MISVVMPVYNSEKFIIEAIQSILNQTYKDFKFFIVDDGSTDRTVELITPYTKEDPRLKLIRTDHEGVSNAINIGIEQAKSDWVAIMHGDDIALPQRLEKQMKAARSNPNVVAWGSYAYHINENAKILGLAKYGVSTEEEFYGQIHKNNLIQLIHPTAFIRKNDLMDIGGYDRGFRACEDLDLFERLSGVGPVLVIPEVLLLYRIHRTSNTMERFFEARTLMRYIRVRQKKRREESRLIDWKDFKKEYDNASVLKKAKRLTDDLSQFYYRKFAVEISNECYLQGLQFLCLSMALNPKYTIPRIWNQRFSKVARSFLRTVTPPQ